LGGSVYQNTSEANKFIGKRGILEKAGGGMDETQCPKEVRCREEGDQAYKIVGAEGEKSTQAKIKSILKGETPGGAGLRDR